LISYSNPNVGYGAVLNSNNENIYKSTISPETSLHKSQTISKFSYRLNYIKHCSTINNQ
jgi:hypothetical protein